MSSNNVKGNGISPIPPKSRKIVQSLKEIVNFPDQEIYAMLKECNMDPNDAVQKLLSQDSFHEVKSRKEKKKEAKETLEPRSRGTNSISNRINRGGTDRNYGHSVPTQISSSEYGTTQGKLAYKRESESNVVTGSSSTSSTGGNTANRRTASLSNPISSGGDTSHLINTTEVLSPVVQSSTGFRPAWIGAPGQLSMADVVKMGRLKPSSVPITTEASSRQNVTMPQSTTAWVKSQMALPSESQHTLNFSQESSFKSSKFVPEQGVTETETVDSVWPSMDKSTVTVQSFIASTSASSIFIDPLPTSSNIHLDRSGFCQSSQLDDDESNTLEAANGNMSDHIVSTSVSDRQIEVGSSGDSSSFEDTSVQTRNTYQSQKHATMSELDSSLPPTVDDSSTAISNATIQLHNLRLHEGDINTSTVEENPAVIIPNHLQIPTTDRCHLSFGSFESGINATYLGSFSSKTMKSNLEETPVTVESSNSEIPEYYVNEELGSSTSESLESRNGSSSMGYQSSSQPEVIKTDNKEDTQGHQYTFSSASGYTFDVTSQPNPATYSYAQTSPQMQNLVPLSSVMQEYTNALPNNLLAPTVQAARDPDLSYSSFLSTQSMPTKYGTTMSLISGPSVSMPEAPKPSVFSTLQLNPQTLPSTSIPTASALPQHLPVHPYTQPTLPLGHFTNMIGYPFLQNYAFLPSTFQQAYPTGNSYPQSQTLNNSGLKYSLPHYKNNVSISSLPQSATTAYGGFGSSTNIPSGFTLNPSSTPPSSTTMSYDDVISSQYKEANHYSNLQQNDNSGMWVHGPSSRTYYSYQGQNPVRQGQQPSHYSSLVYPNLYQSQTGVSQEHQQSATDGTGSQGPQSQQVHQIWQHGGY